MNYQENLEKSRDEDEMRAELNALLKDAGGTIAVFLHDSPDPDALASAFAFSTIAKSLGLSTKVFHGDIIDDPANQAFAESLPIDITMLEQGQVHEILDNSSLVIMLDAGSAGENNILPPDFSPDIIIDHHKKSKDVYHAKLLDIRPEVGATSTLLTQYLKAFGPSPSPELASALIHGIRTDTAGLTRHVSPLDMHMMAFLVQYADTELLDKYSEDRMDLEAMDVLGRAILNKEIIGPYLLSFVDFLDRRTDLSRTAEIMLRLRTISTVIMYGIVGESVIVSARSRDPDTDLNSLLKAAFTDLGTAGGHANSAGAQLPLDLMDIPDRGDGRMVVEVVKDTIKTRLISQIGGSQ